MRRFLLSIGIHEAIWLGYSLVTFLSPEDRLAAKVFLLIIFVYFASLISFTIGKTKMFVFFSLTASTICFFIIQTGISLIVSY
ncbi:hypothetical protein DCC39_00265 [Pueribacillus theae]|uniref:Uncharacterized protein n=1 Tax=Pueribacillus theae TaxID=2171751 RepID=A0A2U1K7Y9_9BACI|nr:hypothetical protein [Pueribacillus theae]PWA13364.1 hypothetical protein DCC39_00265 [Pueribacillus theae]